LPFRLGRHSRSHLALDSPLVSQRHAQIEREGDGFVILDLGSTNGTFVNGERVLDRHPLQSGDLLHLGDREFRLREERTDELLIDGKTLTLRSEDLQLGFNRSRQLKRMIDRRQAVARFQPIHRLSDHSILGFEALGRGVIAGLEILPGELFDLARRLEMEGELSLLLRERVLEEAEGLPAGSLLFLNTHPLELEDPEELLASLRRWPGLTRLQLILEVHETAVADLAALQSLRSELAAMGVDIAFDDFGKGQARLLELTEASPRFLKFDAAWIRGLLQAPSSRREMLGTLVRMVGEMGIDAIAEGVETEAQLRACADLGFHHAQGYYFNRPQRLEDLVQAAGGG
jgi:EAL domain-containing protein (putative c-di-GMP-specific phosphodiesterase class I)